MNMIEKVARAILKELRPTTSWDQSHPHEREQGLLMARAAIEAMKEPTKEMLKIGATGMVAYKGMHEVYQAMIDAALKE